MKTKLTANSYVLIAIMVIMLIVIIASLGMHPKSQFLPLLLGSVTFILAAIELGKGFLARDGSGVNETKDETSGGQESRLTWHGYLLSGAWLVGFVLVFYLLGFLIATPLFILLFMKTHGVKWLKSITFAIVIPAMIYLVFQLALNVDLHPGLLLTW